jgi:hypothetical protein
MTRQPSWQLKGMGPPRRRPIATAKTVVEIAITKSNRRVRQSSHPERARVVG